MIMIIISLLTSLLHSEKDRIAFGAWTGGCDDSNPEGIGFEGLQAIDEKGLVVSCRSVVCGVKALRVQRLARFVRIAL